jgi:hypothetical protein
MSAQTDFIAKYRAAAEKISTETGIPVERILGQAGHETGWNINPPGNNFFGIKAGGGYSGKSQSLDTTEDYGNGTQKVKQDFRAYDTPEESFRDWAKLIKSNRYQGALQPGISNEEFAQNLKDAGYATDPLYAPKLANVINSTKLALDSGNWPVQNIGMGPQPAMQIPDVTPPVQTAAVPGIATSTPDALDPYRGLLGPSRMSMNYGSGLLAAANTPGFTPMAFPVLQPHYGNPQALQYLRGLLG